MILTLNLDLLNYGEDYIDIYPAKILIDEKDYLNPNGTEVNIHGETINKEYNNKFEIAQEDIERIKEKFETNKC